MYNVKDDLYQNHKKVIFNMEKKEIKKSFSKKSRKMFYTKGKQPILASGLILKYKNKFVMQCETNMWTKKVYLSDFGGKIEFYDSSPYIAAVREFMEETNGYLVNGKHNKFTKENRSDFLKKYLEILGYDKKGIYVKKSKYLLFFVEVNLVTFIKMLKIGKLFQETENNGIYHKIIILNDLTDEKNFLHPRLNSIF